MVGTKIYFKDFVPSENTNSNGTKMQFSVFVPHFTCHFRGEMALVPFLRLGGVPILSAAPFRLPRTKKEPVCQIDLLLQTRRAAVVVEIKRRREIGEEVEAEVARKVAKLPVAPGTSIRTALVFDGHLAPVVRANGYFDAIVSTNDLFGLGAECAETRA